MNKKSMLNQEQIHRYFNHLSGAKRIEFLYGLLHLCQPLELRYLGTCLEEIARKDYEYLYHAEQKTNHLPSSNSIPNSTDSNNSSAPNDLTVDEKLDLTDKLTRAHAIVDIALLWAKNRACAVRIFRRLKASECVKLVDMLLERDDLDERVMDEILIIFCLAANHPAFSFDMRTQMSQTLKELEKRERKLKAMKAMHQTTINNTNDENLLETLEDSNCSRHHLLTQSSSAMLNAGTLNVHASPLLTRLTVLNFDVEANPMRVQIKAEWSDNNSTTFWKSLHDIRSFHLNLSNIVYHDDVRLERLMNISGYLRDIGTPPDLDNDTMKKNISIYMGKLVYFSPFISTISTLAKFFHSSLKLVDSKQRLYNSNNAYDESISASPSFSNGVTPLQSELPNQNTNESENKSLSSPKLTSMNTKPKIPTDVIKQTRSNLPTSHSTQTGVELRSEGTQTERLPGPGTILADHQDYLRRYSMEELAKLTPPILTADGLDAVTAQLLCGALEDLKPMTIHLSNSNKNSRSPNTFVQIPASVATVQTSSSSSSPPPIPPPPPLLDAALMTVVQQQPSPGTHASLSSSPSPKVPKQSSMNGIPSFAAPLPPLPPGMSPSNGLAQNQHHVPLLAAHSFLYNAVEPYIFPISIPPGFPSGGPDIMRIFAPNMTVVATNGNSPNNPNFITASAISHGSSSNSRSTNITNGTVTPPEQNGQNHHSSPPPSSSSRHSSQQACTQQIQQQQQQPQHSQQHQQSQQHSQTQQQNQHSTQSTHHASSTVQTHPQSSNHQPHQPTARFRHRQHYPSDSMQYQQNGCHPQQQRQSQNSYSQQSHNRTKACYTCGDLGHFSFACPEQYPQDSNYSHTISNNRENYKVDYRQQQNTNLHQQQRQLRSNSNSKTKLRDNS